VCRAGHGLFWSGGRRRTSGPEEQAGGLLLLAGGQGERLNRQGDGELDGPMPSALAGVRRLYFACGSARMVLFGGQNGGESV